MKFQSGLQPLTADEIMFTSGQKSFDSMAHALYIDKLEEHQRCICEAGGGHSSRFSLVPITN